MSTTYCVCGEHRFSTLKPQLLSDDYADKVTKVRVYRLEDGSFDPHEWADDIPWQVDGIDTSEAAWKLTEQVENYATFEQALAGAQTFCERHNFL